MTSFCCIWYCRLTLFLSSKYLTTVNLTELLDCAAYYTLMKLPFPSNRDGIIHNMCDEQFLRQMDNGNYEITNMGALLFAKDLTVFGHLKRKAIREMVGNIMIHQDLTVHGAGPMMEVFDTRVESSNPGHAIWLHAISM